MQILHIRFLLYIIYILIIMLITGCGGIFSPKADKGLMSPCASAAIQMNMEFVQNIPEQSS